MGSKTRRCRMIWIIQALVLSSFVVHVLLNRMHHNTTQFGTRFWFNRNLSVLEQNSTVVKPQFRAAASQLNASLLPELISDVPPEELLTAPSFTTPTPRTPFFEMFKWEDKMDPEGCDNDFGFGLINRWKAAGRVWCGPSVTCHAIQQTAHGGDGDNICIVENATLDVRHAYNDTAQMRDVVIAYRDSTHADMPYVHFKAPVISTSCTNNPNEWKSNMLPGWNADWMVAGLTTSGKKECRQYEDKPLLIIQRDGFANFYHDSEDFFNAFLALLITGLRPDEVNVLLGDLFPWGPYESFWKHLFPSIRTAWEMKDAEPTCYPKIIVGIFGPASPLTLINQATPCVHSPVVKGYARWVWASFSLNGERSPNRVARILWMSRKSSVIWPERAFCDDRYFMCSDWTHLDVRSLGRVLQNEEDVVRDLQSRKEVEVTNADFNKLPFAEQVALDVASDIMVGPHGAGLTHLLFLPDSACVFEVFIDGSENNIHYRNMASWRGIPYHNMVTSNPAPTGELVGAIWNTCVSAFLSRAESKGGAPNAGESVSANQSADATNATQRL